MKRLLNQWKKIFSAVGLRVQGPSEKQRRRAAQSYRPQLEPLEPRQLLTTTVIDNGDPGFEQIGFNYQSNSQVTSAYDGDNHNMRGGGEEAKATWNFENVADGEYQVAATWAHKYENKYNTIDAPFTIADVGGNLLASTTVDQSYAPSDFPSGGYSWDSLGTVSITGGTLVVTLGAGSSSNKFTVADAIRLEKLGDISPTLTVAISADSISESAGPAATTATVTRTDPNGALEVSLASDNANEATVPATVTIPDGQSSVTFEIAAIDDAAADGVQTVTISATATGYAAGSDTLDVTDDEASLVTILDDGESGFTQSGFTEQTNAQVSAAYGGDNHNMRGGGEESKATWNFENVADGEYQVDVTWAHKYNNKYNTIDAPFSIAGVGGNLLASTTVDQSIAPSAFTYGGYSWHTLDTVNVTGGSLIVTLGAGSSSSKYTIADAVRIEKLGDISPTLTVAISADSISESAGPAATTATVTRTDPNGALEVSLASDNANEATVPATVTIPDGQSSVTFEIAAIDDAAADGVQTVTISATATGYAAGSDTLDVTDDEASLVTILDDGESGFTQSGFTEQTNAQVSAAYGGDNHNMRGGGEESKATWNFENVADGEYQVDVTWAHKYNNKYNTIDAPFSIAGVGGNLLASTTVDQSIAPSAFTYGGYSWHTLDTVNVTGGSLIVTLGAGSSSSKYTIADAVRIERIVDSPPATFHIDDVTVDLDPDRPDTTIDLAAVFDDAEDLDSELHFSIHDNSNLAIFNSVSITGSTLTIDYTPDLIGTADIVVRATDSGGRSVDTEFTVTVNSVTDPADWVFEVPAFGSVVFHWVDDAGNDNTFGVFEVDNADGDIGALSPGDAGYADAALARADQLFRPHDADEETPYIWSDYTAGQYYSFFFIANNDLDAVKSAGDFTSRPYMWFAFHDANADGMEHFRNNTIGGATDYSISVEDTSTNTDFDNSSDGGFNDFYLTFSISNNTPTTTEPQDIKVEQDINGDVLQSAVIDLHAAFDDVETSDSDLAYTFTPTSSDLFDSMSFDSVTGLLTLDYASNETGNVDITVTATDDDPTDPYSVSQTFNVEVLTYNTPPTTIGIDDVTVDLNAEDTVIDLSAFFADNEQSSDQLTYEILPSSDLSIFEDASITGHILTIDYSDVLIGSTEITIQATDSRELEVTATFAVTVNSTMDNSKAVLQVPTASSQSSDIGTSEIGTSGITTSGTITINWTQQAGFNNSFGIFYVDDKEGHIGTLAPGDAPYREKALERAQQLFRPHDTNAPNPFISKTGPDGEPHPPGQHYSMFLVTEGTLEEVKALSPSDRFKPGGEPYMWFAFHEANPDGMEHFRIDTVAGSPDHKFAIEDVSKNKPDWSNGPDTDFNDLELTIAKSSLLDIDVDSDNDGTIDPDNNIATGTDDPIEENSPGKLVNVGDGLVEAKLHVDIDTLFGSLSDWKVSLSASEGADSIRVWDSANKQNRIEVHPNDGVFDQLGNEVITWNLDSSPPPASVWIEMTDTVFAELDFLLSFAPPSQSPTMKSIDKVRLTGLNANEPPVITSNGGQSSASIVVPENQTAVTDVQSTDADGTVEGASGLTYTLTGGADQARFGIVANSGVLTFVAAPDFENPTDSDTNNVYNVQVTVMDPGGSTDVQDIAVTVTNVNEVAGNLTAHRPMHTTGGYAPFAKVPVSDAHEESTVLGPGIRINNDDDNSNGTSDRMEGGASIINENDLIEVFINGFLDGTPANYNNFALRIDDDLKVWTSPDKATSSITFPDGGQASEQLILGPNGQLTIYVEWISLDHGTADVQLIDVQTGTVYDTVTFHTFTTAVIILGGWQQDPAVPNDDPDNPYGMFQIADQIYLEGYDVYKYDEDEVAAGFAAQAGDGIPYDEIRNGVNNRFVTEVSILGYSQGGGSTYNLSNYLNNRRGLGEIDPFDLVFTTYIDAVEDVGLNAEGRLPINTKWHLNLYQQDEDILDGVPTPGGNENINVEESNLFLEITEIKHRDIDHHPSVIEWVFMRFRQNVHR